MMWTPEAVEVALLRAGLDASAFDLEATALDLQERSDLNTTLDALVLGRIEDNPVSGFDARWTL